MTYWMTRNPCSVASSWNNWKNFWTIPAATTTKRTKSKSKKKKKRMAIPAKKQRRHLRHSVSIHRLLNSCWTFHIAYPTRSSNINTIIQMTGQSVAVPVWFTVPSSANKSPAGGSSSLKKRKYRMSLKIRRKLPPNWRTLPSSKWRADRWLPSPVAIPRHLMRTADDRGLSLSEPRKIIKNQYIHQWNSSNLLINYEQ